MENNFRLSWRFNSGWLKTFSLSRLSFVISLIPQFCLSSLQNKQYYKLTFVMNKHNLLKCLIITNDIPENGFWKNPFIRDPVQIMNKHNLLKCLFITNVIPENGFRKNPFIRDPVQIIDKHN